MENEGFSDSKQLIQKPTFAVLDFDVDGDSNVRTYIKNTGFLFS